MKLLVFLGALVIVGLVVTGAITLQKGTDNKISIQIDKDKVREDKEFVIREGKELLEEAASAMHDSRSTNK